MKPTMQVIDADITRLAVDAIVNAANPTLMGGGGVDGAIHRVAGPQLAEECATLGGCVTGDAKITKGYRLPTRYVIHTVGPIWKDGSHNEDGLLASCYHRSLQLAVAHGVKTIAFPAISTGVYGFPKDRAARIAVGTVAGFLNSGDTGLHKVIFCCFGEESAALHQRELETLKRG